MSQLSANSPRVYEQGETNSLPIKASTEIWLGSAVGLTAGYARQLTAGDTFVGFAEQHVNNSVATDGAATIPVRRRGLVQLTITSVAVTDVGSDVYASDGATFTLTPGSNSLIGKVYRYVAANTAIVDFQAMTA